MLLGLHRCALALGNGGILLLPVNSGRINSVASLSISPSGSIRKANLSEIAIESRDGVLTKIAQIPSARGALLHRR
jgi:hypothetical protein